MEVVLDELLRHQRELYAVEAVDPRAGLDETLLGDERAAADLDGRAEPQRRGALRRGQGRRAEDQGDAEELADHLRCLRCVPALWGAGGERLPRCAASLRTTLELKYSQTSNCRKDPAASDGVQCQSSADAATRDANDGCPLECAAKNQNQRSRLGCGQPTFKHGNTSDVSQQRREPSQSSRSRSSCLVLRRRAPHVGHTIISYITSLVTHTFTHSRLNTITVVAPFIGSIVVQGTFTTSAIARIARAPPPPTRRDPRHTTRAPPPTCRDPPRPR